VTGTDPRAGQEAARLLSAAQDWLRTSAPHLAPVADDGRPCSCPVCRAVAGLREADPAAVGRWVDSAVTALGSLVAQAGDLAATRSDADPDPADVPADEVVTPAAREETPAGEDAAGQDGAAPRRVRRIPLEPQGEDPGGQHR
jgi:hypothetical protein